MKGDPGSAVISVWNLLEDVITVLESKKGSCFSVEQVLSIDLATNSVSARFFSNRGEPFRQKKGHVGTD